MINFVEWLNENLNYDNWMTLVKQGVNVALSKYHDLPNDIGEDIIQEVMMKLLSMKDDPRLNNPGFVVTIAKNEAHDYIRKQLKDTIMIQKLLNSKPDYYSEIIPIVTQKRKEGLSLAEIAKDLNEREIKTKWGFTWTPNAVRRVLDRAGAVPKYMDKEKFYSKIVPLIIDLKKRELSLGAIANELNMRRIKTLRNSTWNPIQVKRILDKYESEYSELD